MHNVQYYYISIMYHICHTCITTTIVSYHSDSDSHFSGYFKKMNQRAWMISSPIQIHQQFGFSLFPLLNSQLVISCGAGGGNLGFGGRGCTWQCIPGDNWWKLPTRNLQVEPSKKNIPTSIQVAGCLAVCIYIYIYYKYILYILYLIYILYLTGHQRKFSQLIDIHRALRNFGGRPWKMSSSVSANKSQTPRGYWWGFRNPKANHRLDVFETL